MANVLVVAESRGGRVTGASREATSLAAVLAASLGGSAEALVVGGPGAGAEAASLGRFGASAVTVAEHDALSEHHPEAYASAVVEHARAGGYAAVLFPATTQGKDLAPRVAAHLDVPLATDVTAAGVDGGKIVFERPVFSGKAFAKLDIDATPAVASLRPNMFPATESGSDAPVSTVTPTVDPS